MLRSRYGSWGFVRSPFLDQAWIGLNPIHCFVLRAQRFSVLGWYTGQNIPDVAPRGQGFPAMIERDQPYRPRLIEPNAGRVESTPVLTPALPSFLISDPYPPETVISDRRICLIPGRVRHRHFPLPDA